MVFQKKGGVIAKQQSMGKPKNKKAFEEEDADMFDMDSDDDSDSGDDEIMQKTPGNKTPKGQQVQSDRKVSFQIPGKKTPGKNTPGKNTPVVKKPLTPGKMTLKEFQGMAAKGTPTKNGKAKKQVQQEEEEEEDDDDDDDEDADLDMILGDDDDDDEDDEDEEDEDEDDEDDEPKNKKQNAKLHNQFKAAEKVKTPVKNIEKTPVKSIEKTPSKKNEKTPVKNVEKAKTPVKTPVTDASSLKQKSPKTEVTTPVVKKALAVAAGSRRERDLRTLYLGNLPNDVTPTEIKALSNDIISVNIPNLGSKKRKTIFGFVEFASEADAEENFKVLQKKKLRNESITIDFAGEKSKRKQSAESDKQVNLRRLYVSSIPTDATIGQIAKFFPKAQQISLNTNSLFRSALVNYLQEKDAAEDLEAAKDAEISGMHLTIMYSNAVHKDKKRKFKKQSGKQNPPKKMKFEAKQESSDDDDDDDED